MNLGAAGRADLLLAYLEGGTEALDALALRLGYERKGEDEDSIRQAEGPKTSHRETPSMATRASPPAKGFVPLPVHLAFELEPFETDSNRELGISEEGLSPKDVSPGGFSARLPAPIVPWPQLRRALEDALRTSRPRKEVDVARLVARWSRGESLRKLPRCTGRFHARVALMLDGSPGLGLFWGDRLELIANLAGFLDLRRVRLISAPEDRVLAEPPDLLEDEVLLAVTDLGAYASPEVQARWRRLGCHYEKMAGRLLALSPCPAHLWPEGATSLWEVIDWETPESLQGSTVSHESGEKKAPVSRLLAAMSAAVRVEPGLLRDLRRALGSSFTLAAEVEAWNHPEVEQGSFAGTAVRADHVPRWHNHFTQLPDAVKVRVAQAIQSWHSELAPEIRAQEILNLLSAGVPEAVLGSEKVAEAVEIFRRAAAAFEGLPSDQSSWGATLDAWFQRGIARLPKTAFSEAGFQEPIERVVRALRRRHPEVPLPAGVTPGMFGDGFPPVAKRRLVAWQEGEKLHFVDSGRKGPGSPLAAVWAGARLALEGGHCAAVEVDLEATEPSARCPSTQEPWALVSDVETVRMGALSKPPWADAIGRDRYGLWVQWSLGEVSQRMRWIPPGPFWMGSPGDEPGRFDDEGPRHREEIRRGFWLAETPCTQALWEAAMGHNPSRFRSPGRPVERVSWKECQEFLGALSKRVAGLEVRLPSEAEWEHACRAGTSDATYAGPMEILGQRNAPVLDGIAWYAGNSGVDFDLEDGVDSSDWSEKQHPYTEAGTHLVGLKTPNSWGLYDMLGNVWEWCSDHWSSDYDSPRNSPKRVVRGGSWSYDARYVRAALRLAFEPSNRGNNLGFRLARGQTALQPGAEPERLGRGGRGASRKRSLPTGGKEEER